jgi:hypothetical protein
MIETVEVSSLVLDMNLYPRHHLDQQTIADYVEAMKSGVTFPAIIADKKSRRVVDGWKRTQAALRFAGPTAKLEVEFRTYADEKVLLLEAIHLNAIHGERLTHYDMRRCVILCEQLHVPAAKIAAALNLTLDKFKRISETEVHRDQEGNPVSAAKQSSMHLIDQDKPITDRQNSALAGMIGSGQTFTINQVSRLIEGRLLNKSDERIMAALERLYGLLRGIFEKKENAA